MKTVLEAVTPSNEQSERPGFTPGPWVLGEDYSDDDRVVGGDGWEVASVERTAILPGWDTELGIEHWSRAPGKSFIERSEAEIEANRHLIAAAPALYEVAVRVSEWRCADYPASCTETRIETPRCFSCAARAALALVDSPQHQETR
jgi:hypothetical protein